MNAQTVSKLVRRLRDEAVQENQRRLLVLTGSRDHTYPVLFHLLDVLGVPMGETVSVGLASNGPGKRIDHDRSSELLGITKTLVILDVHDELRPNTIGALSGIVDGGGLLILLTPDFDQWISSRDAFDRILTVAPYHVEDVETNFRRRFIESLRKHRGIAIVSVVSDQVSIIREGLTNNTVNTKTGTPSIPQKRDFPSDAYTLCLTTDQILAVKTLEMLRLPGQAIVIESDRGRGKSSAAGIAAGCLAMKNRDVLVTAPTFENAREIFTLAKDVLTELDVDFSTENRDIRIENGGSIRFMPAGQFDVDEESPDILIVDEAAAIPVERLSNYLAVDRVAFLTTIHGYEGTGRGFSIRFRDALEADPKPVIDHRLDEPIRYAPGDPLEIWSFHALLLDARPPVSSVVTDASPESVRYRSYSGATLLEREATLNAVFGLLVLAHYRTTPDDLARLLDAPNLHVRSLTHDDHVVSVALVAEEGGLSAETCRSVYFGGRINGNMIPDLLMSQLRDQGAGGETGVRIVRIATHHSARSRGLGSHLLAEIHDEFSDSLDWVGAGFGATGPLVSFWSKNGFRTIHLSTSRNERSGLHSAIMLSPVSAAGHDLLDRHLDWFLRRARSMFTDALSSLDPDVIRPSLRSTGTVPTTELSPRDWRIVVAMADGPGIYEVDPGPFRTLAIRYFVTDGEGLTDRQERLLVRKVLQGKSWDSVSEELSYESVRMCRRSLSAIYRVLVDRFGSHGANRERQRYLESTGNDHANGE